MFLQEQISLTRFLLFWLYEVSPFRKFDRVETLRVNPPEVTPNNEEEGTSSFSRSLQNTTEIY